MTHSMHHMPTVSETTQLGLLYGSLPVAAGSNILLSALLLVILWPVTDQQLVSIWLALLVLFQLGRMGLWLGFRRIDQLDIENLSGWLSRFRLLTIGTGLLWGLATWLFFPDDFTYQVFMAFVLAGLSAGAATSLSPDRPSALGFVTVALAPLILRFVIQGDSRSMAMGVMIILFLVFVAISGSRLRQMLKDNEALVQDTRQQQQALKTQRQLAEVITRVQSRFIHNMDRRRAFDELLTDILDLSGSEYGFIGEVLYTDEGDPYLKTYAITNIAWSEETRAFYDANAPQGMEFPNLNTLFGAVLTSGESVIANDPSHDPRSGGLPEGHPALNAFLGIPVYHGDKMVAMLGIANRSGGYDHALIDFLSPLLITIGQLVVAAQVQQQQHEDAERLSASEQRLASVIEGTHIGTWEWNVQTGETTFNERWAEIVGYSLDELVPISIQTWMDLAHPDDLQRSGKLLEQHFSGELDFYDCVARMRHKDGHWVWVHDRGRVVSWTADGKPLLMSGTHADVTDQKQAEQTLLASEARLRGLFELSPIGIALNDYETGAFIDLNEALLKPSGYSRDEFTALSYWEITPREYESQEKQQLESMEKTGRYGPYEKEYIRKDGSRYPVLLNGMVVYDSNGRKLIWSIIEDITERKRIDRMKSEFISTVSHELRTPLTAISGAIGLVVGGAAGELSGKMQEMLEIAHKNSQRLGMLINDLLDMEKLVAGKMRFQMQVQALQPLLEQAVQDNQIYAESLGVRLRLDQDAGVVRVRVDAHRLYQVLANLLSNAVKFSPEDGQVMVSVERGARHVRVSVSDHGPGIPDEFRKHIFQKFAQADASDSRQKSGTGLGLAITRELVERMGGHVGFDSVPGEGASFWFELPVSEQLTGVASHE